MKIDTLLKVAIDKWVTTEDLQLIKNGPRYDVKDLIDYSSKNLKPVDLDINTIDGADRSKRTGFSQKRYDNTDLKWPIIVDEHNTILNGRHRVLKAKDQDKKTIKGYILDSKLLKKIKPIE